MELVGRDARGLAAAVRSGEAAARDVVRAHLDHLAAVERRLGGFAAIRGDDALAEAEEIDGRGDRDQLPLAGVPVGVQDVIDVAGLPTRRGSSATPDEPASGDDEVVKALRAAGAVVIGKTRCSELAIWGTSDDPSGTAVSPWDPSRSAGGAAGGSGAAVAAGTVPIAIGVDSLGDVRIPAAACGTLGMRPGRDLLPYLVRGEPHDFGLTRFGAIATTVGDLALAMDVMAGTSTLREVAEVQDQLSVAVSWRSPALGVVVSAPWREAATEAGRLLRHLGHEIQHEDPPYDRQLTQAIIARSTQGAAAEVAALGVDSDLLQPRTRAHAAAGERLARVTPVRDVEATRWRDKAVAFFERFDVLVTPGFARVQPDASAWHTKPWAANLAVNVSAYPFQSPWNLGDLPSVAVPIWEDHGRPLSVQVVAGPGREDLVLAVAAQLERLVPWTRHAPGWDVPDQRSEPG